MDAKKTFTDLQKIPVIGDLILSFAIIVVLITLSSAGGYFGLEGKEKETLINIYIYIGVVYFVIALLVRIYKLINKK